MCLFGVSMMNNHTKGSKVPQIPQLRGHAYMLHKQRCFSSNRRNFFSIRIVSMWNSLPAETTDFSGLDKFNKSVSNMFLLTFCQVNFKWIPPCDTDTYIVRFLCHYVHNSIIFLWLLCLNCFITLLQHVRGQSALCCQINVCMYVFWGPE